jgi:hypothetical protein
VARGPRRAVFGKIDIFLTGGRTYGSLFVLGPRINCAPAGTGSQDFVRRDFDEVEPSRSVIAAGDVARGRSGLGRRRQGDRAPSLDRLRRRERVDGGAAQTGEMGGGIKKRPRGPRKPLKRLDSDKEIKVNCGQNPSPFQTIPRIFPKKPEEIKAFPRNAKVYDRSSITPAGDSRLAG